MNLDEIGPWSEIKLAILREYAAPYSNILKSNRFHRGYIDAFSGPGLHIKKADREEVLGSPLVALGVQPAFNHTPSGVGQILTLYVGRGLRKS